MISDSDITATRQSGRMKPGLGSWLVFFAAGFGGMALSGHSLPDAARFGALMAAGMLLLLSISVSKRETYLLPVLPLQGFAGKPAPYRARTSR